MTKGTKHTKGEETNEQIEVDERTTQAEWVRRIQDDASKGECPVDS